MKADNVRAGTNCLKQTSSSTAVGTTSKPFSTCSFQFASAMQKLWTTRPQPGLISKSSPFLWRVRESCFPSARSLDFRGRFQPAWVHATNRESASEETASTAGQKNKSTARVLNEPKVLHTRALILPPQMTPNISLASHSANSAL